MLAAMSTASSPSDSPSRRLLVLGAGPAGYPAAFRAAERGWDVTLVDRRPALGGTCLHAGCIPSKALLHAAETHALLRDGHTADMGIVPSAPPHLDLPVLRAWKEATIAKLADGLAFLAKRHHVRRLVGEAHLVAAPPTTGASALPSPPLALALDGTLHPADALLLAPGSVPALPRGWPAPSERIWTSDQALAVPCIPARLAIIGGGVIGLELGLAYAQLGASVTLLEALPAILPAADRDLLVPLLRVLRHTFAAIRTSVRILDLRETADAVALDLQAPSGAVATETFTHVLVATGRCPDPVFAAEAAAVGLVPDARGFLPPGPSALPAVYVAGDAATGPMLAHKATREALAIADAITLRRPFSPIAPADVPSVVYTRPTVAWTGLTETAAKAAARPVRVIKSQLAANGRALATGAPEGHYKLVLDPSTAVILGGGAVGQDADWAISAIAHAVAHHLRPADFALGIAPHPSLAESLASLGLEP